LKEYIKFAIGFIAFLLLYGTAGALEVDAITIRHAIIRIVAIFAAAIIGVVVAVIKQNREEGKHGKQSKAYGAQLQK
jgi:ABC-type proline/glycine betaine transport system permease subunit